jgi:hypothetical protein
MRKCMAPDCLAQLTPGHLMCKPHWYQVPKEVKQEVQRRLRGWRDQGAAEVYLRNAINYRKLFKPGEKNGHD